MNNKHGLSTEQIAELPDYYAKPVAVFRNGNDFIVLTDMQATTLAGNQKPVMVYLKAQFDNGKQTFLASAYPRENSAEVEYVKLAKDGKLAFVDKERAASCGLEDATLSQLRPQVQSGSCVSQNLRNKESGRRAVQRCRIQEHRSLLHQPPQSTEGQRHGVLDTWRYDCCDPRSRN